MPPRTRSSKHRKAKKDIDYNEESDPEYTDYEDAFSSDQDDYVLGFENLTVNAILEGGRIRWSDESKALIIQHAIGGTAPFTAHSLPTPQQLLTLGQALHIPLNRGKEVAEKCIDKLVACIQNLLSEKGLRGGLIQEYRDGDGSWKIEVSEVLIKAAGRSSFTLRDVTSGKLAKKHAKHGRQFKSLNHGQEIGKTALVRETMSLLVRSKAITKDSNASPTKPMPDLSWLKSPSPGPAATSPMPPPAIGKTHKSGYYGKFTASDLTNYSSSSGSDSTSESESESQSKSFVTKGKTKSKKPQKKMPSANEYMSGALQSESMDETPTPKPKKSSAFNKYSDNSIKAGGKYMYDSEDDIIPPKQNKSSSANKDTSHSAQSDSEDETPPPKPKKSTSAKKDKSSMPAAAAAVDDSASEDQTPVPKHKKSVNKKDNFGPLAAAQSENEADIVPKLKDSRLKYNKKSLLTVRDEVEAKSRKQKHVSFDESDEPTNTADVDQLADGNSTSSKAKQKAALTTRTAADDNLPKDVRNYIAILKELDFSPTQIADMVMRKMADKQQAAASKSATNLIDVGRKE